jgi:hypothetical protein
MTNKQKPVAVEQLAEKLRWLCHYDEVWPLVEQALAEVRAQPTASDEVRVRHKVRGTCYSIVGEAEVQTNHAIHEGVNLVVYRGDDGKLWCRPKPEFEDGRFETLTAQAKPQLDDLAVHKMLCDLETKARSVCLPSQPDDATVERVAIAIAREVEGPHFDPFHNPEGFEFACRIARAAIAAMNGSDHG